jgi:hypothetical protein
MAIGQVGNSRADEPGQKRVALLAHVVGLLELLVPDGRFQLLDQRGGNGLADPIFHEQSNHQCREVDREAKEEQTDRSGRTNRPLQHVLAGGGLGPFLAAGRRWLGRLCLGRWLGPVVLGGRRLSFLGLLLGLDRSELPPGQSDAERRNGNEQEPCSAYLTGRTEIPGLPHGR